ncbi:MAG: hypothetical protein DLM55_11195 [Acidimicrobiales bacterium]|nr:MAG: hypothetical protein DLM55_11195 [Acidimicrobiales bacterium]
MTESTEKLTSGMQPAGAVEVAGLPRRQALCLAAAACVGVGALAACGTPTASKDTGAGEPTADAPHSSTSLAKVSDVPVGGGKLVTDQSGLRIMLTQPSEGVIKAFDARCTHQNTIVDEPNSGAMTCPNHGSRFNAADGAVLRGPARSPLNPISVQISGGNVVTA